MSDKDKPITVHVQVSQGWGYMHHVNELERVLKRDIGAQQFRMTVDRDAEKTKNFEVEEKFTRIFRVNHEMREKNTVYEPILGKF